MLELLENLTTATFTSEPGCLPDWSRFVATAAGWAAEHNVQLRDAIVLVPFAQQLNDVRAAWGRLGGWVPRVETSSTLAVAMRRGAAQSGGELTFDVPTDRLLAVDMLRAVPAMAQFCKSDPRSFSTAAADLVTTAHAIAKRAAAIAPSERSVYWEAGRVAFEVEAGPGGLERLLAKVAFEWAAVSPTAQTDPLFDMAPSGWIVLKAGGLDKVTEAVIVAGGGVVPCLLVDADPNADDLLTDAVRGSVVDIAVCEDFEDEAQATAAQLLLRLNEGMTPVGLIAQDRSLVRRTCALLRRQGVAVTDETGWKISTTRCGAVVMGLLRAANWRATNNQVLDWLKGHEVAGSSLARRSDAIDSLESSMRRYGWTRPGAVVVSMLSDAAAELWKGVTVALEDLSSGGRLPLSEWLARFQVAMAQVGDWQMLCADEVGVQAIHALRMDGGLGRPQAWLNAAASTPMSFEDFAAFVSDILELESFVPAAAPESKSQVVVTPLPRAMLRQFPAMVFPAVDEKRLAGPLLPHPLLSEQMLLALGLPTAAERRASEALAFAQVLRAPNLTLLRRRQDGSEPLAASALVQRLEQTYIGVRGVQLPEWTDPRNSVFLDKTAAERPQPAAADLLPEAMTASSIEALRDCPYKFFATALLGLREQDELEDALEKRDYGTWLHAVLFRFHKERVGEEGVDEAIDVKRLLAAGRAEGKALGLDDAELVPYQASFELFVPKYIKWQRDRERLGHVWLEGELEVDAEIEGWGGTHLRGRLDRVDRAKLDDGYCTEVLDYKSGSTEGLKQKAKSGLEDTQLAVYEALVETRPETEKGPDGINGLYLSVDDRQGVIEVRHPKLSDTARAFVEGIAIDLSRIKAGRPLGALGEGRSCEHCSVRGLCRRDHWPEATQQLATA